MTKEKMIEMLFGAINSTADAGAIMGEVRRKDGKISDTILNSIPEYKVASVIYALETELAAAEAKKSGNSNKLSVMKNILKAANDNKPVFKKTVIVDDYQVALDGYRALFLKNHVNVPINEVDDKVTEEHISSFKKLASDLIGKINENDIEITAADYKAIDAEYRTIKAIVSKYEKDKINVIIDNKYVFRAHYLIDGLKAAGTDKIFVKGTKTIAAVKTDDTVYFLMPVGYKNISEFNKDKNIFIQDGKIIK